MHQAQRRRTEASCSEHCALCLHIKSRHGCQCAATCGVLACGVCLERAALSRAAHQRTRKRIACQACATSRRVRCRAARFFPFARAVLAARDRVLTTRRAHQRLCFRARLHRSHTSRRSGAGAGISHARASRARLALRRQRWLHAQRTAAPCVTLLTPRFITTRPLDMAEPAAVACARSCSGARSVIPAARGANRQFFMEVVSSGTPRAKPPRPFLARSRCGAAMSSADPASAEEVSVPATSGDPLSDALGVARPAPDACATSAPPAAGGAASAAHAPAGGAEPPAAAAGAGPAQAQPPTAGAGAVVPATRQPSSALFNGAHVHCCARATCRARPARRARSACG